jgi:Na+/melibiose symporter-like transporter
MSTVEQKLSFREKFSYGFGDLASVLYWQTFMLYFTYFYTDVFLIPAGIAATMFLMSRIWDGVNDPVMGMVADRTKTRWGHFRPFLLWLCLPFAFIGVLTFTVPDFGLDGKIIYAYITFNLMMMMYTAINIPYTALLGVISPNSDERTSVSSFKFLFAFSAGIIVSATLLPMAKGFGGGDRSIIDASIKDQIININEVKKGSARVVLTAEDSGGLKNKLEFGFRINPVENNVPRLVNPLNDLKLEAGFKTHQINITNIFKGDGKDPFEYSVNSENENVVKVEVKNKTLLITEKKIGNAKISLSAADKNWGSTTNSFYIDVVKKGNHDPYLNDTTNFYELKKGFKKIEIDLAKLITDPDGDALSYQAESSNPQVISKEINGAKLTLWEGNPGVAQISIIALDGQGGRLLHSIKYLISDNQNNPPFIMNPVNNIITTAGFNSYQVNVSNLFIDPEGKPLKYHIEVINEAKGWQYSFIVYGIAAVIFFFIAFKGTKERVQPPTSQKSSIKKDLSELFTNTPWLILLATTIMFILFVAVRGSVTVHYFKYVVGTQQLSLPFFGDGAYDFETLTSAFNTIGQISAFVGVLLVSWFARLVGKKKAFIYIFVIAIISTGAVYFLSAEQLGLLFFLQITGSITGGPLSVLIWAMYADTADYGEWKRGRRTTGLIFSASTMSQKIGWAFGAFVALSLMSQLGFEPNKPQSGESLSGLILLFSLIPAGFGVLATLILLAYPISDKRIAEIGSELEERRKASDEETKTT